MIGALLTLISLAGSLWSWLSGRALKKQGADAQSARETSASLDVETRIGQAEAEAPKNVGEVIDRAEDGTF